MNNLHETEWNGLTVKYEIEAPGYEGDPSVPGGIRYMGETVEQIWVYSPSGDDLTEFITEHAYLDIEEQIYDEMYDRRDV